MNWKVSGPPNGPLTFSALSPYTLTNYPSTVNAVYQLAPTQGRKYRQRVRRRLRRQPNPNGTSQRRRRIPLQQRKQHNRRRDSTHRPILIRAD